MAITKNPSNPIGLHDQALLDHRKVLDQMYTGQGHMRDRTVIFLSSGTVGLSLLLLQRVWDDMGHTHLVFGSWGSCTLSLLAALVSFTFGRISVSQQMVYLNATRFEHEDDAKEPSTWIRRMVDITNSIAILGFAAGAVLLLWFTWVNLPD